MITNLELRDMCEEDLPVLYQYQLEPVAQHMAAFTPENFNDREAFDTKWRKILSDDAVTKKTIVVDGKMVGTVGCFERDGRREVTYWVGQDYWKRGYASSALAMLTKLIETRPLYAYVAKDNVASIRVLEKCGFEVISEGRSFANARNQEIEELLYMLS